MMAEYDDDDQDILHIDDITKIYGQNIVGEILFLKRKILNNVILLLKSSTLDFFMFQSETQKLDSILESTTNREEWQLELEKVLPRLKVTVKTGIKYF